MDSALAARLPAEMLDRIGQIEIGGLDAGFAKKLPQQFAGRSDEGLALPIFVVAGHLTDEHEASLAGAFAGDTLRRAFPQLATTARVDVAFLR